MQPTPAGADTRADFGSITVELKALDSRLIKLRRFAEVKRQLRELRNEYAVLADELFGKGAQ